MELLTVLRENQRKVQTVSNMEPKDRSNRLQGALWAIPVLMCSILVLATQYSFTDFLLIFGGGVIAGVPLSYWWAKTYKSQLQEGTLPSSTNQSCFLPIIIALFVVLGVPGVQLLSKSIQMMLAAFSAGLIMTLIMTATVVIFRTK